MAELSSEDRAKLWRGIMRYWSSEREELGPISKHELRDAIDAVDVWLEANGASFNNALPLAARTALTLGQKTLLLCAVATARVSMAFARRLFGGI